MIIQAAPSKLLFLCHFPSLPNHSSTPYPTLPLLWFLHPHSVDYTIGGYQRKGELDFDLLAKLVMVLARGPAAVAETPLKEGTGGAFSFRRKQQCSNSLAHHFNFCMCRPQESDPAQ